MVNYLDSKRIMGTNADRTGTAAVSGGWVELGRTTLGSAGDNIDVTGLADKRYLMVLIDEQSSGKTYARMRFNADSGNNYSARYNTDGASESTLTAFDSCVNYATPTSNDVKFSVNYVANHSTNSKSIITPMAVGSTTAGAGNAPTRRESASKWANITDAISQVNIFNGSSGDFASGSECVVLGYDPDDTHTTNFWEELASVNGTGSSTNLSSGTITAKKYLWIQAYCAGGHAGGENIEMTFNNDTGSNYAYRRSINGGADATGTSQTHLSNPMAGDGIKSFMNMFVINNASNEKLCINHLAEQSTAGAANAPNRREHVFKWANTSNQITEIDLDFSGSTNWSTDSIIKVWGAD